MRRILSIKRDNLKWRSLSSALNPTMLVTGGGNTDIQLAFQSILAIARTAIEYQVASNELSIEGLESMWGLRKVDLTTINEKRVEYQKLSLQIFHEHDLSEDDRLTEKNAEELLKYTSETNLQRRIRLLESNKKNYTNYAPYYYYLGMAYVDNNEYNKAKPIFQKYLSMYQRTPIFRYDNMSGCIALTSLTYEKNLTKAQKIELINTTLKNLPHNSAAHLQCALVYIYDLQEEKKGLEVILAAIDDPSATDKEILYLGIANLATIINRYPVLQKQIEESMKEESIMNLDNYLRYCINKHSNAWSEIDTIVRFYNVVRRNKYLNKNLSINIPTNFVINQDDCHVKFYSTKDELKMLFTSLYNDSYITLEEIEKVECFKSDKKLKFLYVEQFNNTYYRLRNIDIDDIKKIKNGEYPRQCEFKLTGKNERDIASFCKKHLPKYNNTNTWKLDKIRRAKYPLAEGYLCLDFNNIQIVYKYDTEWQDFVPCYYQYDDKRIFASVEMESAIESNIDTVTVDTTLNIDETQVKKEVEIVEKDSTTGIFANIKRWFKKDTTAVDTIIQLEEPCGKEEVVIAEKDSTTGFFANIKGWFK